MGRKLILRLTTGLLIACLITASASAADAPPEEDLTIRGRRAGFSPSPLVLGETLIDLRRDLDGMAATGARWLRIDFDWPTIEPKEGVFNWTRTDRVVTEAHARGLEILALPTYTPEWARPAGTGTHHPPTDPDDFVRFVRMAAQRYAPLGVDTWEIWNEPNIAGFWTPKPDPERYADLFIRSSRAIHAVDADAKVLTGGLAPAVDAPNGSQVAQTTFLKKVYAAGAAPHIDAVAIHPYCFPALPAEPFDWNTFFNLPRIRAIMLSNGDDTKKVWLTEFGAPTGNDWRSLDEADQAEMVTAGFAAIKKWSWVGPLMWFSFRDTAPDLTNEEYNFGVMRFDFTPKPSLAVFDEIVYRPIEDQEP